MPDDQANTVAIAALTSRVTEMDRRLDERHAASQTAISAAIVAQEKAVNAAMSAADRAVLKAEAASEKRFEGVNEFRATLSDQAATFVTREAFEALKERVDDQRGRSRGLGDGWGWLLGVAGIVIAALALFMR